MNNNVIQITDSDIKKYQELYKARYGKDIDYQTAKEQATKLVTLVGIITKPTKDKAKNND